MPYLRFVVRHPWLVIIACLGVTLLSASTLPLLSFEAQIETWFVQSDPALAAYDHFREEFQNDEYVFVAYDADDNILTDDMLALSDRVSAKFEQIEGVLKVTSITTSEEIRAEQDLIRVADLVGPDMDDQEKSRILELITRDRLYKGSLSSMDGKTGGVLIKTSKESGTDIGSRSAVVRGVDEVMAAEEVPYQVTGSFPFDIALFGALIRDQKVLLPIMLCVFVVVLGAMFRSWIGILVPSMTVVAALVWTFGALALTAREVTVVTGLLPIVLLAIGIADSVHLIAEYNEELSLGVAKKEAVVNASRTVFIPCLFTSLTTSLGFLGLLVIQVAPLREFGVFAALGSSLAFLATFSLVPALLTVSPRPTRVRLAAAKAHVGSPALASLFRLVSMTSVPVLALSTTMLLVGLAGLPRVFTSVNFYEYLKTGNPVIEATDYIEERIGGTAMLEILVTPKGGGADDERIKQIEALRGLEALQAHLEANEYVEHTVSVVDFVKTMNRTMSGGDEANFLLPDTREAAAQLLLMYELDAPDGDLYDFVSFDFSTARMMARISMKDGDHYRPIMDTAKEFGAGLDSISVEPTGALALITKMELYLLQGMLRGFLAALTAVSIVMLILLRTPRHGLLALIPAVLPVVTVVGIVGWLRYPITSMPAMMANVSLGIAVDNAIHILTRYRRFRTEGLTPSDAIGKSVTVVGRPVLYTTVVLCLGFAVLIFSEMLPGKSFGILSMATLSLSLGASLTTLPAMVLFVDRRFGSGRASDAAAGQVTDDRSVTAAD